MVMEAFGNGAGIWLPHSTYAMLGNPHLHWIPLSQARRGDLMFYGSGHVEINTTWHHQIRCHPPAAWDQWFAMT